MGQTYIADLTLKISSASKATTSLITWARLPVVIKAMAEALDKIADQEHAIGEAEDGSVKIRVLLSRNDMKTDASLSFSCKFEMNGTA
jgi:hypothetical protein